MALAVSSENSTLTDGTEQTLATPAGSQVYVFDIDCSPMQNGDVLEIRLKKKVRAASTLHVVWRATVGPSARSENVITSPPIACPNGCTITIKRVAGTDRTYDWSLMTLQ